jgi:hypothetical protein
MPRSIAPAAIIICTFLMGCGTSIQSLDKQQQYRFSNMMGNAGKIMASVQVTGQRHGGRTNLAGNTGGDKDQDTEELVSLIDRAVQRGDCKMPRVFPTDLGFPTADLKNPKTPAIHNAEFVIEGAKCPIAVKFQMIAKGDAKYAQGNYEMKYEVVDKAAKGIVDLDKMELSGQITLAVSGGARDAGSVTSGNPEVTQPLANTANPFSVVTKWTMEGDFRSVTEGNVHASLKMDSDVKTTPPTAVASNVEFSMALGFKDFRGELRATSRSSEKGMEQEFYLNTQKLTAEEFTKVFPFKG